MCTKYDTGTKFCLECADEYVLVDFTFTDSVSKSNHTSKICVKADEHKNCLSDLLKLNSSTKHIEVSILFFLINSNILY